MTALEQRCRDEYREGGGGVEEEIREGEESICVGIQ